MNLKALSLTSTWSRNNWAHASVDSVTQGVSEDSITLRLRFDNPLDTVYVYVIGDELGNIAYGNELSGASMALVGKADYPGACYIRVPA